MSLDKAIKYGKEHRKQYTGAKAIDRSCRNHGNDDWAIEDRTIQSIKENAKANSKIEESFYEDRDDERR